jgi:hypothetical protein
MHNGSKMNASHVIDFNHVLRSANQYAVKPTHPTIDTR